MSKKKGVCLGRKMRGKEAVRRRRVLDSEEEEDRR